MGKGDKAYFFPLFGGGCGGCGHVGGKGVGGWVQACYFTVFWTRPRPQPECLNQSRSDK